MPPVEALASTCGAGSVAWAVLVSAGLVSAGFVSAGFVSAGLATVSAGLGAGFVSAGLAAVSVGLAVTPRVAAALEPVPKSFTTDRLMVSMSASTSPLTVS